MKKIIPIVLCSALLFTACTANTPTESVTSETSIVVTENETGWFVEMQNYAECSYQDMINGFGQGLTENAVYIGYRVNADGTKTHGFAINVDNVDTFVYATENADGTYTYEVAEDFATAFEEAVAFDPTEVTETTETDVEPMSVEEAQAVADEAAAQAAEASAIIESEAAETATETSEE